MADLRAALQDALGPVYRVQREVRPVGDCRLFVAVELPAGPDLLVKVLPGPLSLALDSGVFERELILLADQLRHPNIVTPRGAGRAGSFAYHTRRFVEGTTLRAWLVRQGELPLRQTVAILQDVLAALAHLHAVNVAHGDLKPENVLLTDGEALVADAGIVGAVERSLPHSALGTASAGLCAATYIAPERRDGGGLTGPRDDMFAVGVLAHEMLTGRPPTAESESLEEVRSLPAWLRELVRRCLVAEPAGRWPDATAALGYVNLPNRGVGGSGGLV
ncbi:MAG TPA: serine/threonine-protein kinase [Gemmataceae bacterium]|nr:serine/threonine-protein kinase [Gemmataceae bacterium]